MIGWFEKKRSASILMVILTTIEIFFFSTLSSAPSAGGSVWPARIYHFVIFFLFSFFLLVSIKRKNKLKVSHIILVLVVSIIHAVLDEIHQTFVPFRDASFRDVLNDTLGSFLALAVYSYASLKSNKK